MSFSYLLTSAQQYFPNVQVKYKDKSLLMKILDVFSFFYKSFRSKDSLLIGDTIYFPSEHFIKIRPISGSVAFMYELVHLRHSTKKAYLSSLYVIWRLSQRLHFNPHLQFQADIFIKELIKPWTNQSALQQEFQQAIDQIQLGHRPFQDPIFDILDDLITKV